MTNSAEIRGEEVGKFRVTTKVWMPSKREAVSDRTRLCVCHRTDRLSGSPLGLPLFTVRVEREDEARRWSLSAQHPGDSGLWTFCHIRIAPTSFCFVPLRLAQALMIHNETAYSNSLATCHCQEIVAAIETRFLHRLIMCHHRGMMTNTGIYISALWG